MAGGAPVGEVALLFTDVEGSTSLVRALGEQWSQVLVRHHELLRSAIEAHGGWLDHDEGDGIFATFSDPRAAAGAAVVAQRAMRSEPWPAPAGAVRVRMGLHVGTVQRAPTGYVGLEIHRAARVASAAHGGQLLVTQAARVALAGVLELDELGLHRLKDFPAPEHLYCAVIDGAGAADFPSPRTLGVRPTNLSPPGRQLIGRGDELRQVAGLVGEHRLVTITGRGGCGKTSLGLAVAEHVLETFTGGAWWVPLATLDDLAQVLPTVAAIVRTDPAGRMSLDGALVARLEAAPTLLVLDNMEHLLGAGAAVESLLHRVPDLRVLATAQVPLGLAHEHVFVLGPLDSSASLDLFVLIARTANPELALDSADIAAIEEICARLDGQPLALELAAARLSVLTPQQVRDRLFAHDGLLRRPARDAGLDRHRSLAAEVTWSLGLLDPPCRDLFARMGAFAQAASLEDLEAASGPVAAQVVDALDGLVRFAMVQRIEDGDAVVRFAMPEAVRQLAVRALDRDPDSDRWRRAHAEHVRDVLDRVRLLHSCSEAEYAAARRLDADAALALAWAARCDATLACDLAALWSLCLLNDGQAREARELIAFVERSAHATRRARAHAALALAKNSKLLGDLPETVARCDRLLPEMEAADPDLVSYLWSMRGKARAYLGDLDGALSDCATATARDRAAGTLGWGGSLVDEAEVLNRAARTEDAFARLDEFAALEAQHPQRRSMYARYVLNMRGEVEGTAGRHGAAIDLYLRSMRSSTAHADDLQLFYDLASLASALIDSGALEVGLEVAGIVRASAGEQFGSVTLADRVVGTHRLRRAIDDVGADRAGQLQAAGTAVPAGQRLVRAGELVAATRV